MEGRRRGRRSSLRNILFVDIEIGPTSPQDERRDRSTELFLLSSLPKQEHHEIHLVLSHSSQSHRSQLTKVFPVSARSLLKPLT